jgi:TonB family protein
MQQQRIKFSMSKYILASAAFLLTITVGCNSNDKQGSTSTTTDTSSMSTTTTTTPMDSNTSAMNNTTTPATTPMDTTKAKPNPSKKGMKGKVSVMAQSSTKGGNMAMDNSGVYNSAEVLPMYVGGSNAMSDFFNTNVEYPQDASDNGIEGTVMVNFAVDEMGKLSSPKIVSPRLGYGLEEEALRVVNKMPTWTPGKIKGKNVKTYYTLPVRFQLY